MAEAQLPTSRRLINALFTSIAAQTPTTRPATSNTLKEVPPSIKSLLLTLHVLFPNEFLPALDVLDRKLVIRIRLKDGAPTSDSDATAHDEEAIGSAGAMYLVRSAQQPSSHSSFINPQNTHYEVRPIAWNCSCPAFAFSAFPAPQDTHTETTPPTLNSGNYEIESSIFGGLSLSEQGIPVCKHLLACVLAEQCPALFGENVEARELSREEWAGWCAGWGG